MKTPFYTFCLTSLIATLLLINACSTAEKTADPGTEEEPSTAKEESEMDEPAAFAQMLDRNRSKLSDVYNTIHHDMPDELLKEDSTDQSLNRDPSDGFRVQIISTRDVQRADSVSSQFRMWADSTISGYSAQAYVFFKQPYYRVHIGDFQDRQRAIRFSRLVKKKYPDAWVVPDRIQPSEAPADTASFSFMTPEDRQKKALESKQRKEKKEGF